MKKLTLLATLAFAATSSAFADNYIGGSIGSGATIHYQSDQSATSAVRYGLNLSFVGLSSNGLTLGGGVDYLNDVSGQSFGGLNPYYGFGLDAAFGLGSVSSVVLYPHVLGGLSFDVSNPLSIFAEVNAGPAIGFATGGSSSATGVSFGYGGRLGLNYRLP